MTDKIFLGISYRGNPLLGVTVIKVNGSTASLTVVIGGIELFGIQVKKTQE
ncbi:MAG: hypothetical protein MUP81_02245 [Dehalococcoidia bacterium]|nr:hypothetical protein [Dehalococcoidia bacterium]